MRNTKERWKLTPAIQPPIPIGFGAAGWGFRVSVKGSIKPKSPLRVPLFHNWQVLAPYAYLYYM